MAVVTLTTDFGTQDPFVGIMKGVIVGRAPAATVIDVSHGVPPQNVLAGALVLRAAVPWFPAGSIHVAVVDPGVGSARRALCVETATALFVGPDNGLLSLAAPTPRRIVHLTDESFFLSPRSATFHGRDVFAPVAAALVTGTPAPALGPEVPDMVQIALPAVEVREHTIAGEVVYVDHFGNLISNITAAQLEAFRGRSVSITIARVRIAGVAATYAAGPVGTPVAVVNSWGMLEVAVRNGSARDTVGVGEGTGIVVEAGA